MNKIIIIDFYSDSRSAMQSIPFTVSTALSAPIASTSSSHIIVIVLSALCRDETFITAVEV